MINKSVSNHNQELEQITVTNNNNYDARETHEESNQIEQFIIKRTELADIAFFQEEQNNPTSNGNTIKAFNNFFDDFDLETYYESSIFSITVIDSRTNNYAGIFMFNDTPFGSLRRENYPNIGGIWENWFEKHFEDQKIDGKNSYWLYYFTLHENYAYDEETLHKIFQKVLLSLYTTRAELQAVLFTFKHEVNKDVVDFTADKLNKISNENVNNNNNNTEENFNNKRQDTENSQLSGKSHLESDNSKQQNKNSSASGNYHFLPLHTIKTLTNYLFAYVPEIQSNDENNSTSSSNNLVVYLNRRISVFPIIEIRIGTQEDHDDLERIYKDQTPPEIVSVCEDFFIAKMIADQNENNKVLVGQVNEKAVGVLAVSTDINIQLFIKSFELEAYDNLLKQDYMKAVSLKRKELAALNENAVKQENLELLKRYKQEIMSCEKISQRIFLQDYIVRNAQFIDSIDDIEKKVEKEKLDSVFAHGFISNVLEDFSLKFPNVEQFEGKIKMDEGSCLLTDSFKFFIETLEFFGLPKNYMQMEGHWTDWLKKEAEKREKKEQFRKKLAQDNKNNKRVNRASKKDNEEAQKPSHFDFSPLTNAMRLFKDGNLQIRSIIRRIVNQNKNVISNFFVNEEGDPSENKCFDIMSLSKKKNVNFINLKLKFFLYSSFDYFVFCSCL